MFICCPMEEDEETHRRWSKLILTDRNKLIILLQETGAAAHSKVYCYCMALPPPPVYYGRESVGLIVGLTDLADRFNCVFPDGTEEFRRCE